MPRSEVPAINFQIQYERRLLQASCWTLDFYQRSISSWTDITDTRQQKKKKIKFTEVKRNILNHQQEGFYSNLPTTVVNRMKTKNNIE